MTNRSGTPPPPALLTPDELGEKGQTKFQDLCTDVGLIVNGSSRDRAGWDFIVQLPADAEPNASLDKRAPLWTTYVQVKAAWRGKRARIRLSLSAAELLAKQLEPAFIAALTFNRNDLEDYDVYLIELSDENLATILKALRKAERDGARAINEVHIHLSLKAADRLSAPSGAAIKERLGQAHRAAGAKPYAVKKAGQLQSIGYDEGRLRGSISFHDVDVPNLLDVLLGARSCTVSFSDMVERRFGIDLPYQGFPVGNGTITFGPTPLASCELSVESRALKRRLTFNGEFFHAALPGPSSLLWKSKFDFGAFAVERTHDHHFKLTAKLSAVDERLGDLAVWTNFHRMLRALSTETVKYVLRSPALPKPIRWHYPPSKNVLPADFDARLMLFEALTDISRELECGPWQTSPKSVFEQQRSILVARGFGMVAERPIRIALPSRKEGTAEYDRTPQESLYVDVVDIGSKRVAFASQVVLAPGEVDGRDLWETSQPTPIDMRLIDTSPEAFAEFLEAAKAVSGIDNVLLGDHDAEFFVRALGPVREF